MFGPFDTTSLLSFLKQLGVALAGASALWGLVFLKVKNKCGHSRQCVIFDWIGKQLFWPTLGGGALALAVWCIQRAEHLYAHEGIVLLPHAREIAGGMHLAVVPMWLLAGTLFVGVLFFLFKRRAFIPHLDAIYAVVFILTLFLTSFTYWTGSFDSRQWFFIGHNVHSIFTIGTVLVLDYLFLLSKSSDILKQHIYPMFPTISKLIWIGLAVEFVSVSLVFSDAIALTPKFFFMQTVIGILIINGVFLAGPVARKMIASVRRGGPSVSPGWQTVGDLCGTISITSWTAITFVDFFEGLPYAYGEFILGYLIVIAILFFGHLFWTAFASRLPIRVSH